MVHDIRHWVALGVERRRDAAGESHKGLCAPHIAEAMTNHRATQPVWATDI
jgi:hypothetical protein